MVMKKVMKYFDRVDNLLVGISSITLFIMMTWIFLDVLSRTFFNQSITGTLEITGEYFMVIIVFLAISYTQKVDGHIKVTLFQEKFPAKVIKVLKILTNLLSSIIIFIMSFLNLQSSMEYLNDDVRSLSLLNYPLAPAVMLIALGLFIIAVRLVLESVMLITSLKRGG